MTAVFVLRLLLLIVGSSPLLVETESKPTQNSKGKFWSSDLLKLQQFNYAKALCDTVYCSRGEECVVNEGFAKCVCRERCPAGGRQACGSNGVIFPNSCALFRQACLLNQKIQVVDFAHCQHAAVSNNAAAVAISDDEPGADDDDEDGGSGLDFGENIAVSTPVLTTTTAKSTKVSRSSTLAAGYSSTLTAAESSFAENRSKSSSATQMLANSTDFWSTTTMTTTDLNWSAVAAATTAEMTTVYFRPSESMFGRVYVLGAECDQDDFEFLLNNLLLYYNAKHGDSARGSTRSYGKEFLVQLMFDSFDSNNDKMLTEKELIAAETSGGLQDLEPFGCRMTEFLKRANKSGDTVAKKKLLTKKEFLAAFGLTNAADQATAKPVPVVYHRVPLTSQYQIRCNFQQSATPIGKLRQIISWQRFGVALSTIPSFSFHVSVDGDLYLAPAMFWHAGNFTCTANETGTQIMEIHMVDVVAKPKLHMKPDFLAALSGETVSLNCVLEEGLPTPKIHWTKNGELYSNAVSGRGTFLHIENATVNDTGTYTCKAQNDAGAARAFAVVLVRDAFSGDETFTLRRLQLGGDRLAVFTADGVQSYGERCERRHVLVAPPACGNKSCDWGETVVAGVSGLIYASLPSQRRLVVLQAANLSIVQVIELNHVPKRLWYLPWEDSVWLELWWDAYGSRRTVEVIRSASESVPIHAIVHALPLEWRFDVVENLFLPSEEQQLPYGYVVHRHEMALHKIDLHSLRNVSRADLSAHSCHPDAVVFLRTAGLVLVACRDAHTGEARGQLLLDYLSDSLLQFGSRIHGTPLATPDGEFLLSVEFSSGQILMQRLKSRELTLVKTLHERISISALRFSQALNANGYQLLALSSKNGTFLSISIPDGKVRPLMQEHVKGSKDMSLSTTATHLKANTRGNLVAVVSHLSLYVFDSINKRSQCEIPTVNASALAWTQ